MHYIAQKQIFFKKLPELDLDLDLVMKYPDLDLVVKFLDPAKKVRNRPDPDPQHCLLHIPHGTDMKI